MNERQRFLATMNYQPRDRAPIADFGFWPETLDAWKTQGLPQWVNRDNTDDFFGMDDYHGKVKINSAPSLSPAFEAKVIEDRGDHELFQQHDGNVVLRKKVMGSIPLPISHALRDRETWTRDFKWRLDPTRPNRYDNSLFEKLPTLLDPNRDQMAVCHGGGLYGGLRNWMGVENLSLVLYDDPAFFEEMVTTVADCIVASLKRAADAGARFDACSMWEDMCYNAGPLISPAHFKQYLVPHYKRIVQQVHRMGVTIIWLDCDGNIDHLLPIWLDCGINCMFPVEIGHWADPLRYRKQYGKPLRMMGGFNKHIMATTKPDIAREIHRLTPLVEEGGYIPFADHRVPPDVPLENYLYYLKTVRKAWGKDTNLNPMHEMAATLAATA